MSEAQHLAEALKRLYWGPALGVFASFETATDGLRARQSATVPTARFNSVWAIANHVWYWQEALHCLLLGQTYSHSALGAPDDSGWPPVDDPDDEAAWQADRQRALSVNTALANFVEQMPDRELESTLPLWAGAKHRGIQSIIAHNSYHTCEIISVRHMQGLWLERT
jgi:hypothetical protein